MNNDFATMAANNTWAISLEGFLGKDILDEALASEDPHLYRKKINSLSMVVAVKDAIEYGKNIVFFTSTLADSAEQQEQHLDYILQGLGFMPKQARELKDNIIATNDDNVIAVLRRFGNGGVTMITNSERQIADAPESWQTVRIIPRDSKDRNGIKNPDWFMFFMTRELKNQTKMATAAKPAAPQIM